MSDRNTFSRYAPFIQKYIYRRHWEQLREVQTAACSAVLDHHCHVIISSNTASGKTEAAFFPALTQLQQDPPQSIGIIYISPLKALINDQHQRLQELLQGSGIPVWSWHGDVAPQLKDRMIKNGRGVLQITPESLESLLMNRASLCRTLFADLRFVIIDEIHALMGIDRGLQVQSLICRLEQLAGCRPRRIGLSATISDLGGAESFISAGSCLGAMSISFSGLQRQLQLAVESFVISAREDRAVLDRRAFFQYIYDHTRGRKALVFANSRSFCEELTAELKTIARERLERDVFYVHHGSIAAELRGRTEAALREPGKNAVAAATVTLELGIDIGDLDLTVQVGSPFSCSSFVQRLGRSGRSSGVPRMLFVNQFQVPSGRSGGRAFRLPWDLLRSIAVIDLYTRDRWIEPVRVKAKPFSLLAHQTLSVIKTAGELDPPALARQVLSLAPFAHKVTPGEYKELLLYMLRRDLLERLPSGRLIIGLGAEGFINHYSFYAQFTDEKEYTVVSPGGEIGTLGSRLGPGSVFSLAGRSWEVKYIDDAARVIYVHAAEQRHNTYWPGSGGSTHDRIVQRMRQILTDDAVYPYLQPQAAALLRASRRAASARGLLGPAVTLLRSGGFRLNLWYGTTMLQSLMLLLSELLREPLQICEELQLRFPQLEFASTLRLPVFLRTLQELKLDLSSPDLLYFSPAWGEEQIRELLQQDKYDFMVPLPLLKKAYLANKLDLPGAFALLQELFRDPESFARQPDEEYEYEDEDEEGAGV